jgi:hypothetical protein
LLMPAQGQRVLHSTHICVPLQAWQTRGQRLELVLMIQG